MPAASKRRLSSWPLFAAGLVTLSVMATLPCANPAATQGTEKRQALRARQLSPPKTGLTLAQRAGKQADQPPEKAGQGNAAAGHTPGQDASGSPRPGADGGGRGPQGLSEVLAGLGYRAVDIKKRRSGDIVVGARVNGRPLTLMIDTGAQATFLDRSRTRDLKLDWKRHPDFYERDGNWYMATMRTDYVGVDLRLGDVLIPRVAVRSLDIAIDNMRAPLWGEVPIDGILGMDLLDKTGSVIDLRGQKLYVRTP